MRRCELLTLRGAGSMLRTTLVSGPVNTTAPMTQSVLRSLEPLYNQDCECFEGMVKTVT